MTGMAKDLIIVGVDASEPSRRALRWAAAEAKLRKASLDVVHVYWVAAMLDEAGQASSDDPAEAVRRFITDTLGDSPGVAITPKLIRGRQASAALTDAAQAADLLVVGARGAGGFDSLLLGSVSGQCAHHAHCPLVIVR